MESKNKRPTFKQRNLAKIVRPLFGILVLLFIIWRLYLVFIVQHKYGPEVWTRLLIAGLIIGSVYSLIAIGYTLVYGILLMINFAHGELMMIGAFAGFFIFEATNAIKMPSSSDPGLVFVDAFPVLSIILAFIVGMGVAAAVGFFWKRLPIARCEKRPV